MTRKREAQLKYQKDENELEITKSKQMADIESEKFNNMVSAIGADTIQAIATSGPEMQVSFSSVSVTVTFCKLSTRGASLANKVVMLMVVSR